MCMMCLFMARANLRTKCSTSRGMSSRRSRNGGSSNAKHIQPVKKIGAEGAFFDHIFEIFISRGNAAEIDFDNLIAADARDLTLLQHAQQIGLRLQADIADFVEEYRATFGDFKFSLLAILRAGERALFVTKEFAFEQRLGERAAVNDDQGMEAAHAGRVNGAYHQLFPGPTLTGDQHIGVGGAHGFDGLEYFSHGRTLADEISGAGDLGDGLTQTDVFFFGAMVGERFFYQMRDLVRIERLTHIIVGAILQGRDRGLHRGVAGHHDHDQVGIHLVQAALEFNAVGAAHFDIEQSEIPFIFGHAGERIACAFGSPDLVAFFAKPFPERIADAEFIVDDQQFPLRFHVDHLPLPIAAISVAEGGAIFSGSVCQGRVTVKVVPRPTSDCNCNAPAVAFKNAATDRQAQARHRGRFLWW